MADPRKSTSLLGTEPEVFRPYAIDNATITWSNVAGGSAQVGLAVTRSAAGVIALAADAEQVLGKLISVEADGYATVQVGGAVTLPGGNNAALTLGFRICGAVNAQAAKGYIREVAKASHDEIAIARHTIEDPTTATAVVVLLAPA